MSSAGHVLDMMNRIKQNRELLKGLKSKKERLRSVLLKPLSHQIHERKQRYFSDEEKAKAIDKIDMEFKIKKHKLYLFETPIFILILSLFIWFMWTMMTSRL